MSEWQQARLQAAVLIADDGFVTLVCLDGMPKATAWKQVGRNSPEFPGVFSTQLNLTGT